MKFKMRCTFTVLICQKTLPSMSSCCRSISNKVKERLNAVIDQLNIQLTAQYTKHKNVN